MAIPTEGFIAPGTVQDSAPEASDLPEVYEVYYTDPEGKVALERGDQPSFVSHLIAQSEVEAVQGVSGDELKSLQITLRRTRDYGGVLLDSIVVVDMGVCALARNVDYGACEAPSQSSWDKQTV